MLHSVGTAVTEHRGNSGGNKEQQRRAGLQKDRSEDVPQSSRPSVCVRAGYLIKIVVRLQHDAIRYSCKVFSFSIGQARPWNTDESEMLNHSLAVGAAFIYYRRDQYIFKINANKDKD